MVFIKMLQTLTQLTLLVQCGMTSFGLNFFSNQTQCSHVFLIIQFPESSNFKQSYFIADETRDFPCIPVLPENFQSAPPGFLIPLRQPKALRCWAESLVFCSIKPFLAPMLAFMILIILCFLSIFSFVK